VVLDENDIRDPRIIFQDKKSEDQGLLMPGTLAHGAVAGGDGGGPIGGRFFIPATVANAYSDFTSSPCKRASATLERNLGRTPGLRRLYSRTRRAKIIDFLHWKP